MSLIILLQDIGKLIDGIEKLSVKLGLDTRLLKYVWWAAVALLLLWLLTWLKKLLWENYIQPLRATPDDKRRLAHRQMFAGVIEGKIRDINSNEEWRDYRFTELEAEVEAEGERRIFSLNPFRQRTRSGLRREKSLTRAIEMSRERLIQLEGDPGSGKSVALRFLARSLAERASKSRSFKSVTPLYLNLKELSRGWNEAVDQNLIKAFVLKTLNKANDRDVEKFLDEEFSRGLEEGTWLFLFDSFDEIPEVLSSTEADATIRSYATAISDFLGAMNRCRGVVASRHFRGPGQSRWPRFRILPLSEARRLKLIRQALLQTEVEQQLTGHLDMASPEIRDMSSNPMLLGLLSEYMKAGNSFPDNVHTVLSSYLEHRLSRDQERVARRYAVDTAAVRATAESAAFCMAADVGLGLSPTRESLKQVMEQQGFEFGEKVDTLLDALVFIKLARSEESAVNSSKSFTFAHRRFQEYFATCVVLREPERVTPPELLSDARWRETAVVLCQSQPPAVLSPLVEEARLALAGFTATLPENDGALADSEDGDTRQDDAPSPERFLWPAGALHVLSLLQDGFSRRLGDLPDDIRQHIGAMLLTVNRNAGQFDRKSGLEVAGAAPNPMTLRLLRNAFASDSQLLKNVAYRQVARLGEIPDDIANSIRYAVFNLLLNGRLRKERFATRAHLARLDKPERFISSLNLLLAIPRVDLFLHVTALLAVTFLMMWSPAGSWLSVYRVNIFEPVSLLRTPATFMFLLFSYLSLWGLRFAESFMASRMGLALNIYMRVIAISFLLSLLVWPSSGLYVGKTLLALYLIICVYFATWAPFAMLTARAGQFTHIRYWPIMPVIPLLLAVTNARRFFKWALDSWQLLVSLGISMCGVVVVVLIPCLIFSPEQVAGFLKSASLPMMVLSLMPFLYQALLSVRDRIKRRKGSRRYTEPMTGKEFANLLVQYLTEAYRRRFIRTVRTHGQLTANQETDEIIERLALAIERDRHKVRKKDHAADAGDDGNQPAASKRIDVLSDMADFDAWYAGHFKRRRFGASLIRRAEILDELTLLLEQVRAQRRAVAPLSQAATSTLDISVNSL